VLNFLYFDSNVTAAVDDVSLPENTFAGVVQPAIQVT
jgi:hypothetical protein